MILTELKVENFRIYGEGDKSLNISFKTGLTAIVGENDSGKSSIIDAIRFALGTTDQDWYKLEESDFHKGDFKREIRITCKFENLGTAELRAFVEYLTYDVTGEGGAPSLHVNWIALDTGTILRGRPFRRVEMRSGKDGNGPTFVQELRERLKTTYLRPLRDAESALSSGRGSRLSQVLLQTKEIESSGVNYDPDSPVSPEKLGVLGIGDFANDLLEKQQSISDTKSEIDTHLGKLSLHGDGLKSSIKVSSSKDSNNRRLRQLLEKLDLTLSDADAHAYFGKLGLGSNNLLFIACELLLIAQDDIGCKLLLIEEPEAHLHTQRQLSVMSYLQKKAVELGVQIIVTTHSPNLASTINLNNIVMLQNGNAFSLAQGKTKLEMPDYRFLTRFLDVTKANLFFARGVMIVEGDAENVLLPTIARLIDCDFTAHGISIVNVGGVGLRRYAKIFQRNDENEEFNIPVACVTDMDVMPNCAPEIIGKIQPGSEYPALTESSRRWRAKRDFTADRLVEYRSKIDKKASGQCVKTYVSDEWTMEYDLAYFGLADEVYIAAHLAKKDASFAESGKDFTELELSNEKNVANEKLKKIKESITEKGFTEGSDSYKEHLASHVYAMFTRDTKASKPMAAQYLADIFDILENKLTEIDWQKKLPPYLIKAIEYVTRSSSSSDVKADEK
ncbi:MAG: AAA family ATPase [Gammaproteobacteria bacterium]|nr:AAA family ATPase [Gammaproteobacteria bacterium]MCF6261839.1 AAA family ATPase [Gammaproteobacteria bacterium]